MKNDILIFLFTFIHYMCVGRLERIWLFISFTKELVINIIGDKTLEQFMFHCGSLIYITRKEIYSYISIKSLTCILLDWPHIWQPYSRIDENMSKYIERNVEESTQYLIFVNRPIARASLGEIQMLINDNTKYLT